MADVDYITLTMPGGAQVQVVDGSQLHAIYASMGATPGPADFPEPDPYPQYVDEQELDDRLAAFQPGGGAAAVSSVNGYTGEVVLGTDDINGLAGALEDRPTSSDVTSEIGASVDGTPIEWRHNGTTYAPRPATTRPLHWIGPESARPALNGSTAGGTVAAVPGLDSLYEYAG